MFQRDDIGQTQGRQTPLRATTAPPAFGEGAKVGIRQGQHHQICGTLAQIHWRLGLVQPVAFPKNDMHGAAIL